MLKHLTNFCFISNLLFANTMVGQVFLSQSGHVHFISDAPLEMIQAESDELKSAIDTDKNTFAFSMSISSFQGFNSPLQQEHFNENYMDSKRFKAATFTGKIIEDVDLKKDGNYTIRAKGKLTVHGVERERIIKSTVQVKDGVIQLQSQFTVLLDEHDIEIPKIVYQKIAEEITVEVETKLKRKEN